MIHVAALTGGRKAPSARFRIRQMIPPLAEHGICVREYANPVERDTGLPRSLKRVRPNWLRPLRAAWTVVQIAGRLPGCLAARLADVVWIERHLLSSYSLLEKRLPRPRILDVDDAIWLSHPFVRHFAGDMDLVVAGNSFIAEWFQPLGCSIHIAPTAIDTQRFCPAAPSHPSSPSGERFVVGWSGTQSNLKYVYDIEAALARFLALRLNSELRILCNDRPVFRSIPPDRWTFHRWSPAEEVAVMQTFDVGLMPLRDGEWERGKCSLKMLQYMACGIPVCVSPVGTNLEVAAKGIVGYLPANESQWCDALDAIYCDRASGRILGANGRRVAEEHYSVTRIARDLAAAIRQVR
jgi:glycosyltransferase involved in cell wall biosynthesis